MMSVTLPVPRPRPRAFRPRGRGGFSLVELLVVIFILAVIAVVGMFYILPTWQRQKLQSASTDIKVLFQRALPEMQRRNMQTFVQVGPYTVLSGAKFVPIYLIGDADGDGVLGTFCKNPVAPATGCPDLLIDEYDIIDVGKTGVRGRSDVSPDFCLSDLDVTQIASTLWSDNSLPRTSARSLMCDFRGRAIDTITGRQIAAPATLILSHVKIVNGSLGPTMRYVISINPVWSVRVAKQIKVDATNWVTENG